MEPHPVDAHQNTVGLFCPDINTHPREMQTHFPLFFHSLPLLTDNAIEPVRTVFDRKTCASSRAGDRGLRHACIEVVSEGNLDDYQSIGRPDASDRFVGAGGTPDMSMQKAPGLCQVEGIVF